MLSLGETLTPSELQEMMDEVDSDRDGKVSFRQGSKDRFQGPGLVTKSSEYFLIDSYKVNLSILSRNLIQIVTSKKIE